MTLLNEPSDRGNAIIENQQAPRKDVPQELEAGDPALLRYGVAFALIGLIMAHTHLLWDTSGLAKMLALSLGVFAAWLGLLWRRRLAFLPLTNRILNAPAAAFLTCLLISAFFSMDRSQSWTGIYGDYFYGVLPLTLCAGLYYAVANAQNPQTSELWLRCALAASAADNLYSIDQQIWVREELLGGGRSTGSMANPIFMSAMVIAVLPLALHHALSRRGWDRLLGWGSFSLGIGALFLSGSRSALVGGAISLAAYFALSRRECLRSKARLAYLLIGISGVVAAGLFAMTSRRTVKMADSMRAQIWHSAARIAPLHPLLGSGPETFPLQFEKHRTLGYLQASKNYKLVMNYAHNDLLQILTTMGALGLLAYLWVLWGAFRLVANALDDPQRRGHAAAAGAAILGLFCQAKVNPVPSGAIALSALWLGLIALPAQQPPAPDHGRRRQSVERLAALCCIILFGSACWTFGRKTAADFSFRKALSDNMKGAFQEALPEFVRALKLSPREVKYYTGYDNLLSGCIEYAEKEQQSACMRQSVQLGRDAVALMPNRFYSHQLLGLGLLRLSALKGEDHWEEADRIWEHAQTLNPGWLPVYRFRRDIANHQKDTKKLQTIFAQFQPYYNIFKQPNGRIDW